MIKKHYDRLGLGKGASKEEIKKAYRKKAMLFHPDRNKHPSAEQKFINLNFSYEILMDYVEGGAPTYSTRVEHQTDTNSEEYKRTTYYQNTRFTIAEMEAAWARQRDRERKEYEDYLNLPWWSPTKLFEYCLHSCIGLVILLVLLPLLILGIGLLVYGQDGSSVGGIILIALTGFVGLALYKGYKK